MLHLALRRSSFRREDPFKRDSPSHLTRLRTLTLFREFFPLSCIFWGYFLFLRLSKFRPAIHTSHTHLLLYLVSRGDALGKRDRLTTWTVRLLLNVTLILLWNVDYWAKMFKWNWIKNYFRLFNMYLFLINVQNTAWNTL